jgi:predicted DNA-binding protein
VKKTSVYLDEGHVSRLRGIAEREGRSQADIIRDAIDLYDREKPDRDFALARYGREHEGERALNEGWEERAGEMYDDILDDAFGGNPPEFWKRGAR